MPTDPSRSPKPTDPGFPTCSWDLVLRSEFNRGYTEGHIAGMRAAEDRQGGVEVVPMAAAGDSDRSFSKMMMGIFLGLVLGLLTGLFLGLFVGMKLAGR